MTTKETKKTFMTSNTRSSDPAMECGPGTHWDDARQSCVPDAEEEVMISAEKFSLDLDESVTKK